MQGNIKVVRKTIVELCNESNGGWKNNRKKCSPELCYIRKEGVIKISIKQTLYK